MPICLYGGTYRAANEYLTRFGVEFDFVDARDPKNVENAIKRNTKLIFCETPANPTLHLTDLEAVDMIIAKAEVDRIHSSKSASEEAISDEDLLQSLVGGKREKARSILFVVDSTFATPCILRPFEYGADVVLHSTTKYFDGHNITTGGVAISRFPEQNSKVAYTRNICGSIMDPQVAYYTLNSCITLPLRLRRQSETAKAIADYLQGHPKVERVLYPGLDSHPQRELALKYHRGDINGGVLGFDVKGGIEAGEPLSGMLIGAASNGRMRMHRQAIFLFFLRVVAAENRTWHCPFARFLVRAYSISLAACALIRCEADEFDWLSLFPL